MEIVNDMTVIKTGERVGSSEAALLAKLAIKPFHYGLVPIKVFDDGTFYDPKILDLKDDDLEATAMIALQNIAAMSLALRIPTVAAIPHMVVDGYKNLMSVAIAADCLLTISGAENAKESHEKNGSSTVATQDSVPPAATTANARENDSESDQDMGFSLFD